MGLQKAESFYENTDLDFDVILLYKRQSDLYF